MKGLIIKDLYLMKKLIMIPALSTVIMGAVFSYNLTPWLFTVIVTTALSLNVITTISMDKTSKWEDFSVVLPVSKGQIISNKYIVYLLLSITGLLLGLGLSILFGRIFNNLLLEDLPLYLTLAVVMSMLPGAFSIPLSYVFDAEKSIVVMVISYLLTSGIFAGLNYLVFNLLELSIKISHFYMGIVIISIGLYFFSWFISSKKLVYHFL